MLPEVKRFSPCFYLQLQTGSSCVFVVAVAVLTAFSMTFRSGILLPNTCAFQKKKEIIIIKKINESGDDQNGSNIYFTIRADQGFVAEDETDPTKVPSLFLLRMS